MRIFLLINLMMLVSGVLFGCGGTSKFTGYVPPRGGPAPQISQMDPDVVIAGSPGFTLTVYGGAFASSTNIRWNGAALATTYVSPSELQAQIPAANVVSVGTATITVNA